MMAGFFGSLIALERAVALQRGLWVPVTAALGGIAAWWTGSWSTALVLWMVSSAGLLGLYAWAAWKRTASLPLAVEASGAACLLAGTVATAMGNAAWAQLGWGSFLILTIAGERRELMRLVNLPDWAKHLFLAIWAAIAAAVVTNLPALWWSAIGVLALWLVRFDVATRLWKAPGWAGHTAICLTVGYAWLVVATVLAALNLTVAWHAVWLGFVMAMVFGHAPIMLPALAGWRPVPTRWALMPLGIMGVSLLGRIAAQTGLFPHVLPWAGAGHVLAIASFGAIMATAVRRP